MSRRRGQMKVTILSYRLTCFVHYDTLSSLAYTTVLQMVHIPEIDSYYICGTCYTFDTHKQTHSNTHTLTSIQVNVKMSLSHNCIRINSYGNLTLLHRSLPVLWVLAVLSRTHTDAHGNVIQYFVHRSLLKSLEKVFPLCLQCEL